MDRINLPDNHRRAVSSSIYVIEEIVGELEMELLHPTDRVMRKLIGNITETDLQRYVSVISEIKSYILYIATKYNLYPHEVHVNRVIDAQKTKMWLIMSDTTSKRLKGYGEFPKEYAQEFDKDIDELQALIKRI